MNRLSSDVVSALRTDVTITSASQCITELVLNSIDSRATSIAVRVDLNLYRMHVIDNGCGISEKDLCLLGIRYMTSKCHSLDDLRTNLSSFGFRGEALASLCEVAGTVMITTRPAGSNNTYCKIITQGRHQKVVHSSRPRSAQGTTILVGDFLYNRPVRRNRIRAAFDLEEIKINLEHIALIHPQVSLSLRDDASGEMILETKKSSSTVDTLSSLYGPAIAETLCAVKGSSKPFQVSGYISRESYANKSLQFIYINKRLLIKSKLHKLVNSIMGRSSILKVNNVPHNPISKEFNSAFFLAMSPPKRTKHAVYILNITCPYSEYDITLDPKKTLIEFRDWNTILNCIETLLRNFLEPHVTPDPPGNGSSLFDEIDRLAREDAVAKGGNLDAHIGIRTILGLPARRDTVVYTPPSQYTLESSIISSGHAPESTVVSSDRESVVRRTSCSEDPCPPQLRCEAVPTISSEDPFHTKRTTRNHEFGTTSQEDSSSVSTKEFLNIFKQPVFQKKLKHRNPETKLPVGDPLHFELNFRRIANMMLPAEIKNNRTLDTEATERRKRNVLQSLQRFSMEKSAQLSPASNDTAIYHTPINAPVSCEPRSKESLESLADLPYSSELVARLGTLDADVTPSGTPAQTSLTNRQELIAVENNCIALQENQQTVAEGDLENKNRNERVNPQRSTGRDCVSQIDETNFPACVPQFQQETSEEVIPSSQQDAVQIPSEVEKRVKCHLSPNKMFISSEDFLISRKDIFENSREPSPGFHPSTYVTRLLDNSKVSNALDTNNSCVTTKQLALETESAGVCCVQPGPCFDCVEKAVVTRRCLTDHNESSEDLCYLNGGPRSSESEEFLNSKDIETSERICTLNMNAEDPNNRISVCESELISEANHNRSSASSNLQGKCVKDNRVVNTRKRNAETHTATDPDEPLNKIVSLENSYFRNSNREDVHCSGTTPKKELCLKEMLPEKMTPVEDATPKSFPRSGDSSSSRKTDRLERHSVVLNCSIDDLVAVLSPKLNLIRKGSKKADARNKSETSKSNEQLKPLIELDASVLTDTEYKITGFSREETETGTADAAGEMPPGIEVADDGSSAELQDSDEGFRTSSSRDESLIAVNDRALLEKQDGALEAVSREFETNGGSLAQSRNTDDEFGISSSRDESLIAVYEQTMLEIRDGSLHSGSMDVERTEGCLPHLENTNKEPGISTFREKSLIAVYERSQGSMLEMDHKEATSDLAKSDCVAACGQEIVANEVDESFETEVNLTDESDDLQLEDRSDGYEEHTDKMGRKYFIHALKGTIRFHHDHMESFEMEDRCRFLPKGLSPLVGSTLMSSLASHGINTKTNNSNLVSGTRRFENQPDHNETVKWPNRKPGGALEKSWPLLDQLLTTFESEREAPVASAIIQDQPNAQIKVYNIRYPYIFRKDVFNNLKVIGQLDRKFIVTIAKLSSCSEQSDVVVLFDQHAVHERIRVERLTKEYRESGAGIVWRSAPVQPALPLSLSAREVRVMTSCSDKFESLGLRFTKNDSHSVKIMGVPTCLLLREDREVHGRGASVLKSHLESLIREEVDALVQTRGAGVEQPAIIRNVIASEACRGAVKFGHILETQECRAFLHNLSSCEVPFQCAHGRPALTPIADLNHLRRHTKTRKPNLWKLRRA